MKSAREVGHTLTPTCRAGTKTDNGEYWGHSPNCDFATGVVEARDAEHEADRLSRNTVRADVVERALGLLRKVADVDHEDMPESLGNVLLMRGRPLHDQIVAVLRDLATLDGETAGAGMPRRGCGARTNDGFTCGDLGGNPGPIILCDGCGAEPLNAIAAPVETAKEGTRKCKPWCGTERASGTLDGPPLGAVWTYNGRCFCSGVCVFSAAPAVKDGTRDGK
jgi:hypothetical protein